MRKYLGFGVVVIILALTMIAGPNRAAPVPTSARAPAYRHTTSRQLKDLPVQQIDNLY